jgi:hypothetical protein
MTEQPAGHGRPKLTRAEQRYNYALAIGAVAVVVVLIVVSPRLVLGGTDVPVLLLAVLVGAFLFGLGQMLVGIGRRRAYLRSLDEPASTGGPQV